MLYTWNYYYIVSFKKMLGNLWDSIMDSLYCAKTFFKILNCFHLAFCFQCHQVWNGESIPAEIWPQEAYTSRMNYSLMSLTIFLTLPPLCFSALHTVWKQYIYIFFEWFEINKWSDQWRKTAFCFVEGMLNIYFQLVQKLFKDISTFFIFYIVSTVCHIGNIQLIINTIIFNISN